MRAVEFIDQIIERVEKFLVVIILFVMITLSCLQIVLRNLFAYGIPVNDIILRHLTLALAFLGASMATRVDSHLKIDIIPRMLPQRYLRYVRIVTYFISAAVCFLLTRASWTFVVLEKQSETLFVFGIPLWYAKLVIPGGFLLMTFRLFLRIVRTSFPSRDSKAEEAREDKGNTE